MSSSQQYQEATRRKRKISNSMSSTPNSVARNSNSSIDEPVLRSISLLQSDSVIIPSSDCFLKQAPSGQTKKPASWDVSVIPGIPLFYPLEQTRVSISRRESSPTEIAKRIVKCLEDLSIAATYNKDQALALAETMDGVQLHICLFQTREKDTLVEIQRKSGSSLSFHRHARIILKCAVSGDVNEDVNKRIMPIRRPVLAPPPSKSPRKMESALELACSMLKKDRLDANQLGMESLVFLTDATLCDLNSIALPVSRILLQGGPDRYNNDLHHMLLNYIQGKNSENDDMDDARDDLVTSNDLEDRHSAIMHYNALIVLANSLETIGSASRSELSTILHDQGLKDLLTVLVQEVSMAEVHPHNAYQATRCLSALLESSPTTRGMVKEMGATDILSNSHVGHALLRKESHSILAALGIDN
jgi:hypothetical protein